MSDLLIYPRWQKPLVDAILEFNPDILSVKVQQAEKLIHDRLHALQYGRGDCHELEALTDALATLEILKGNVDNLQPKALCG